MWHWQNLLIWFQSLGHLASPCPASPLHWLTDRSGVRLPLVRFPNWLESHYQGKRRGLRTWLDCTPFPPSPLHPNTAFNVVAVLVMQIPHDHQRSGGEKYIICNITAQIKHELKTSPQAKRHKLSLLFTSFTIFTSLTIFSSLTILTSLTISTSLTILTLF